MSAILINCNDLMGLSKTWVQ